MLLSFTDNTPYIDCMCANNDILVFFLILVITHNLRRKKTVYPIETIHVVFQTIMVIFVAPILHVSLCLMYPNAVT